MLRCSHAHMQWVRHLGVLSVAGNGNSAMSRFRIIAAHNIVPLLILVISAAVFAVRRSKARSGSMGFSLGLLCPANFIWIYVGGEACHSSWRGRPL